MAEQTVNSSDGRSIGHTEIEMYLSEDILQGETVPFYILWGDTPVNSIELRLKGFASISHLHNVRDDTTVKESGVVKASDLKLPGYLGGLLTTKTTETPFVDAQLDATIKFSSGATRTLSQTRILHTTRVRLVNLPDEIKIPLDHDAPRIEIVLEGNTTSIIDIEDTEESQIELVLPPEVLTAFERFSVSCSEGLKNLRKEFPKYESLIDRLLTPKKEETIREYFDRVAADIDSIRKDSSFMDAVAMVFVGAILEQSNVKETLLIPLLEYVEANAAAKVFLTSPFLSADIPPEGGTLSCRILTYDLLHNECGPPIRITTHLMSKEKSLVPIKELVRMRRVT